MTVIAFFLAIEQLAAKICVLLPELFHLLLHVLHVFHQTDELLTVQMRLVIVSWASYLHNWDLRARIIGY